MKQWELATPATVADADKLEENIRYFQRLADENGKRLVPMTKTHKSSAIVRMQLEAGAAGLLVGTIREAEVFVSRAGARDVTFAYPYAGAANLSRLVALGKRVEITVSCDTVEAARGYEAAFGAAGLTVPCLILIDSGLHRFGVSPADAGALAKTIADTCPHVRPEGVSTHPGQVYGASTPEGLKAACREEIASLEVAAESFQRHGLACPRVEAGSTPTFLSEVQAPIVTAVRPGNYVFFDVMQLAYGTPVERVALTVQATVLARHGGKLLIDAGAKAIGLDKGAHGNTSITGYGRVVGYPGITVASVSEEVGVLQNADNTKIQVGDVLSIIPNHACSAANLTSRIFAVRGGEVVGEYAVDARGGTAD